MNIRPQNNNGITVSDVIIYGMGAIVGALAVIALLGSVVIGLAVLGGYQNWWPKIDILTNYFNQDAGIVLLSIGSIFTLLAGAQLIAGCRGIK